MSATRARSEGHGLISTLVRGIGIFYIVMSDGDLDDCMDARKDMFMVKGKYGNYRDMQVLPFTAPE